MLFNQDASDLPDDQHMQDRVDGIPGVVGVGVGSERRKFMQREQQHHLQHILPNEQGEKRKGTVALLDEQNNKQRQG